MRRLIVCLISARRRSPARWLTNERSDPMGRSLAVLTVFLSGTLVASGSWLLFHTSVTPFLVPGATDIQVVSTGMWEWRITYDAPGPPYAWYFALSGAIEAQQWTARSLWQPDGSTM